MTLLARNIFCKTFLLRSIALTSNLVSIFFTVFAYGSNGGIFSTSEKIRISLGTTSIPVGDFSFFLVFPTTAIEECSFKCDNFSRMSSSHSPLFVIT